ncbi:hypothetical protein NDU88_001767 [Pleurodeles waltl]|uniref:Pecanex-like protein n=1 Tax=Pleurodeles waltl TaxID=8319 RepID=A0AAV7UTN2_PLEWA|nr:hypothetical protein NDU88_001767 [Pleurodeles waltl]
MERSMRWKPTVVQYFVLPVYRSFPDLLEDNMGTAVMAIRQSVIFWKTLPLSVAVCTVMAKMVVLPRLLYFFAVFPLVIPQAMFKELDYILTDLIGNKGCRHEALTKLLMHLIVAMMHGLVPETGCLAFTTLARDL